LEESWKSTQDTQIKEFFGLYKYYEELKTEGTQLQFQQLIFLTENLLVAFRYYSFYRKVFDHIYKEHEIYDRRLNDLTESLNHMKQLRNRLESDIAEGNQIYQKLFEEDEVLNICIFTF
jgi:hypothetical protein